MEVLAFTGFENVYDKASLRVGLAQEDTDIFRAKLASQENTDRLFFRGLIITCLYIPLIDFINHASVIYLFFTYI